MEFWKAFWLNGVYYTLQELGDLLGNTFEGDIMEGM